MAKVTFRTKGGKRVSFQTGGKKKRRRRGKLTPPRSKRTGRFLSS